MASTFYDCHSLTSLNLINFNTEKVQTMNNMFYNCYSLPSIEIINFDTSQVTDMTSMFEKCTGLTTLDIKTFRPNNCMLYPRMFFGCSQLTYVNFYNYYENETTNYDNLITQSHINIKLCINVKRTSRIYLSHSNYLLEECLRPNIEPTTIIPEETTVITTSEPIKETTVITTSEPVKETSVLTTDEDIKENNNSINSESQKETTKIITEDATNNIKEETEKIIKQTNNISSEYIIENDIYKFPGYNNTKIYNFIGDYMIQDFLGGNGQKIFIRGADGFIFEITTIENEEEI